jgi:hypothetical protein
MQNFYVSPLLVHRGTYEYCWVTDLYAKDGNAAILIKPIRIAETQSTIFYLLYYFLLRFNFKIK